MKSFKFLFEPFALILLFVNFLYQGNFYASNIKHSYDVLNYKLNLNIYGCYKPPYPYSYSAYELIKLRVDSTLKFINLDAYNYSLTIDSVRLYNFSRLNFSHYQNILSIGLNRFYSPGETLNIEIYYRHNNVPDTSWGPFHCTYGLRVNNGLVYTDCEPEGARKWFPCWDKPSDKATIDITAKVPLNTKLGSNGTLIDSTLTGDTIYYHWVSKDPMATYLVAIAGSVNYNLDITYWYRLSNPQDSVPIMFYYLPGANLTNVKDSINMLVDFCSQKFGEYPFEKIGFAECDTLKVGCMENQTFITLDEGDWTFSGMATHEFPHHWFGDLITCGTWADLWLNESFATYCEALFAEYRNGPSYYRSFISFDSSIYFLYPSVHFYEPIYNPAFINGVGYNISDLFIWGIRYQKGACVLHMLRNVLGDSIFFNVLHSYATDTNYTFKNAVTDDFTAKINQVTGQDYSWFINEWVKQPGHPVYQNTFNFENIGANNWRVNFLTKQTLQYSPFYIMPIEIKVHFTNSTDTILKVFNNSNNQLFTFEFEKQPDSLVFDPYSKITLRQGTTLIGITDNSKLIPLKFELYQNYPNPFNPTTAIKYALPKDVMVTIKIYDILGKLVITLVNGELRKAGYYEASFDGTNFASGVYFYRIEARQAGSSTGDFVQSKKLVLVK